MRIFYIHGFGENEGIFNKISPFVPGEKAFLNVWELLGDAPRPGINVLDFADELVQKYIITKNDVVIGHSMGGWIALHIKYLTGCRIVQIASWTDPTRIVSSFKSPGLYLWLVRHGFIFNRFVKWVSISKNYRDKPSIEIYRDAFDRLMQGNKENVINQLRLILMPVPENVAITPDLRIHALADTIVRPPKEPFYEVPGDHFTLYTHPQMVYEPIVAFLVKLAPGENSFKKG